MDHIRGCHTVYAGFNHVQTDLKPLRGVLFPLHGRRILSNACGFQTHAGCSKSMRRDSNPVEGPRDWIPPASINNTFKTEHVTKVNYLF